MHTPDNNYIGNPTATRPRYTIAKHTLAFVLAVGLGYLVASAFQHWRIPQPQPNPDILASLQASSTINSAATPVVTLPTRLLEAQHRLSARAPQLSTTVIVGSDRIDNPEQLALPSDSVFGLSLRGNHSGSVAVYAINPEGRSSHIWSGHLHAGQDMRTPQMRLQGVRGVETLRIVFKTDEGDDRVVLPTVIKQFHILHVQ